ncbi:MAG: hypothetical protein LBQ66_02420 [Planctomycetaceae bacterium]|nr:hypothetical protein [Planctomycetaceae bacterium]
MCHQHVFRPRCRRVRRRNRLAVGCPPYLVGCPSYVVGCPPYVVGCLPYVVGCPLYVADLFCDLLCCLV